MTEPLLEPATPLRELDGGDAPYPGTLCAGDPPLVWTDAGAVPSVVWSAAPGGHLLVPRALARSRDGHRVAFVHCAGRLVDRVGTSEGAVVTAAVSIVRAADEALALGVDEGSWWVDHTGRPVLAVGGSSPWRDAARDVLAARAGVCGPALRDALRVVDAALETATTRGGLVAACEEALFAAAVPGPLGEGTASGAAPGSAVGTAPLFPVAAGRPPSDRHATAIRGWLARVVDDGFADRVIRVVEGVRRRRPPARGREERAPRVPVTRSRRPLLLGAAVAALVVAGGVLWPGGDAESKAEVPASPASAPESMGDALPGSVDDGHGAPEDDGDADAALVRALSLCAAAQDCGELLESPGQALPPGAATVPSPERSVTLLDDYGGVRALRVDAPGEVSQVVVVAETAQKRLVREIYDLADQP
ncbi:hypothetical protein [Microbacterium sp. No. 7]|uniref:hypothetical protein n=1 Tax=Microbacterium sp. No. 7 TaxID=1714373 RepID=UPI0006D1262E|nr:hypothetical protein [Microbacterium sp. No. 7]ALJ20453.1 hypothetical protein AOA12_11260 [Microbacterium sp. No. 7]